jgi:TetR/AcrR family transcriptional regulator, repressor of fatR-cypB operon
MGKPKIDIDTPKREAILNAALDLFAERGFHGTPVPMIAERARVGAGTLYRYFSSKEEMANALYQRWKTSFAAELIRDLEPNLSPREGFHRVWRRMLDFQAKYPIVMKFLELHHHHSYLDQKSLAVEQRALTPIRDFVVLAQTRKMIKPLPPEAIIALVYGAYVGLVRAAEEGFLELEDKVIQGTEAAVWDAISV